MRYSVKLAGFVALAVSIAVLAGGCSNGDESAEKAASSGAGEEGPDIQVTPAVNASCPIMTSNSVTASIATREFEGKTVGFCCASCPAMWDKLNDEEKREKLAAVTE